jgi:hypothetical protein
MEFNVNYRSFARGLMPHFFRNQKFLDFLNSFVKPLKDINDQLIVFRDEVYFRLAFNSQIIYLEKYLNTVYPNPYNSPNDIHIIDGANIEYFYIWNNSENEAPVYFFNNSEGEDPIYLFNDSEQTAGVFSYTIYVPNYCLTANDFNGQLFNENIFKKRVNFYNNAGKTYNIVYF